MVQDSAEKYSNCHTYGRSKTLIKQRLNQIEQHLQQARNTIQQFDEEILSKCAQYDDCYSAIKQLFSIIHQFLQEKQRPLQHELEYKRAMSILDGTDHQLVQTFFDVEPNKTHVRRYSVIYFITLHFIINLNFILDHFSKTYMAGYNETNANRRRYCFVRTSYYVNTITISI
jgi:hypothetical protein